MYKEVVIKIQLTPSYSNKYVNINETYVDIAIRLLDGEQSAVTDIIDVGTLSFFSDPVLQTYFTVCYTYDSLNNKLTLCGNDLISDKSAQLTSFPRGTKEFSYKRTYSSGENFDYTNQHWNHNTPLTPGLDLAFEQCIRKANNQIITRLRESGVLVIERTPVPELSTEDYEKLCPVYYRGNFLEFYDPNKTYTSEHSIRHFGSYYQGTTDFQEGFHFSNALGTTNDPFHGFNGANSWLQLWIVATGVHINPWPICTSQDCCSGVYDQGFCNDDNYSTIGGHVVPGFREINVVPGGQLYIVPICNRHNLPGRGIFMTAVRPTPAIIINHYMS